VVSTAAPAETLLDAALDYARRGLRVVPLYSPNGRGCTCRQGTACRDAGKHPRLKEWPRLATTDPAQIRAWLRSWPDTNIGIATGAASGVFVLDVDPAGLDWLAAREGEHGRLQKTPTVLSGRRGQHFYFAYPRDITIKIDAGEIAPGVDVRAEGGLAAAPPSRHLSGTSYAWFYDPASTPIAPAPEWLLALIQAAQRKQGLRTVTTGGSGDDGAPIPERRRNDALAAIAGRMRWAGLTTDEIVDVLQRVNRERCQPPLDEEEVAAVAKAMGRYVAGDGARAGDDTSPRISRADFAAHLEAHKYLYRPTGKLWPRASVNAAVDPVLTGRIDEEGNPVYQPASDWLDEHAPVHQITWSPGDPEIIEGRLLNQGGWIERPDFRGYNLYRPPTIALGDPEQAGRWIDHVHRLYPDDAGHIIQWLGHRAQHPAQKINHALLLGGLQGCGKDTILKPVRDAVGPWNFAIASPPQVVGRFNGFLRSVILLIPELYDLGDVNKYGFYEHVKPMIAAPPDTHRCDEKFLAEVAVPNVTGVIFTSNQRIGIYLPAGDRRHLAAWSELDPATLPAGYFEGFHRWLDREQGCQHVEAYLHTVNLAGFDPTAPPPKTEWFWSIVDAGRAPEESELSTLLDSMSACPGEAEWPDAVTLAQLVAAEQNRSGWISENGNRNDFASWLDDRKNRRQIPHRMEAVGYVAVRNDGAKDGLWKVGGARMAVYAKRELERRDQLAAVSHLVSGGG
jgi:hypothetical protein